MKVSGPSAPTRAQLQTEINALTKTVNQLKTAYSSHCHTMSGLNYTTGTTGVDTFPYNGGGRTYYFVVTKQSGAGSYGWQKTSGPSSC